MYDIIIVGAGIVGLVNASLLAKKTSLRIAVVDAKPPNVSWSAQQYDHRVYAITPASQGIFEMIDVWSSIQTKRVSPFKYMQVWDATEGGMIAFDHAQLHVPTLGYIVEESLIRAALYEKIISYPNVELLSPITLTSLHEQEECVELSPLSQGSILLTKLLIGADGAQSWVREKTNIALQTRDYQQISIIAQVQTELPHQMTAWQTFLSKGPLAFLPLLDAYQSSIVWTTSPGEAEILLKMDDAAFQKILTESFHFRLGNIISVSKRYAFSLYERHSEQYVKNRVALIGDAVHTVHPLAGQGLNLGIADAASLAKVIIDAVQRRRDFSSLNTLRRYERECKGNNVLMLNAIQFLNVLFKSEKKSVQFLRSQGLNMANRLSLLKKFFARYAMG